MLAIKNWLKTIPASLAIHTWDQVHELISSKDHGLPMQKHRADILLNRTFFFASLFAVLTPAWVVVDWFFLAWPLWGQLALMRLFAGGVFVFIAWQCRKEHNLHRAMVLLAIMLLLPALFFMAIEPLTAGQTLSETEQVAVSFYTLLPFVIAAGLSLFPLSLREFILFSMPIFAVTFYSAIQVGDSPLHVAISTTWLFLLILGVSLFSSLNQLRYMISQTSVASYDELTGTLTRRAGIEALELQFRLANLKNDNISLAFIDLDHFKSLNDTFGHKAGDDALRGATTHLKETLRKGDFIIRWGGEEFIVILPGADTEQSRVAIQRIMDEGLGGRPDGTPLTASIGVAEMGHDKVKYWKELVELADHRMYQAKESGRARSIDSLEEALTWAYKEQENKTDTA